MTDEKLDSQSVSMSIYIVVLSKISNYNILSPTSFGAMTH
jgi:hypothetical protein